jgi:hypothetical protein
MFKLWKKTAVMAMAGVALALAIIFPAMAGCRGTLGMTSCTDPPEGPQPQRPFQPRPAGKDTSGPGKIAPPSGPPPVNHHGRAPSPVIANPG